MWSGHVFLAHGPRGDLNLLHFAGIHTHGQRRAAVLERLAVSCSLH